MSSNGANISVMKFNRAGKSCIYGCEKRFKARFEIYSEYPVAKFNFASKDIATSPVLNILYNEVTIHFAPLPTRAKEKHEGMSVMNKFVLNYSRVSRACC